jgi:hypothetical protein
MFDVLAIIAPVIGLFSLSAAEEPKRYRVAWHGKDPAHLCEGVMPSLAAAHGQGEVPPGCPAC